MPTKTKILLVIGLAVIISASFYLLQGEDVALAGSSHNLSGFAWSSNIGWISFNCTDRGTCGTSDYGVDVNGGVMSGHAWSDNIGWIDFNPSGSYPEAPMNGGRLDTTTGQVTGWAKAAASGGPGSGGWDGWIKLRGVWNNPGTGESGDYGVLAGPEVSSNCDWGGYAWGGDDSASGDLEGDEVIGWVSFKGPTYGVKGTGDACSTVTGPDLIIDTIGNIPDIIQGTPATFSGRIKNVGNIITNAFNVRFCVGGTRANCLNVGNKQIGGLKSVNFLIAGGTNNIVSDSWSSLVLGNHDLFVCADVNGNGSIAEINEGANDNCKKKNFNIVSAAPICGNNVIESGEQCDSGNLGGQTCVSLGFTGGTLSCNLCNFNTNSCTSTPVPPSSPPWWWWIWQEK